MKRSIKLFVISTLVICFSLVSHSPFYASSDLSSISGTVYKNGRPITGLIHVIDIKTGNVVTREPVNNQGHFIIRDLIAGEYILELLGPDEINPIGNRMYIFTRQGRPSTDVNFEVTEKDKTVELYERWAQDGRKLVSVSARIDGIDRKLLRKLYVIDPDSSDTVKIFSINHAKFCDIGYLTSGKWLLIITFQNDESNSFYRVLSIVPSQSKKVFIINLEADDKDAWAFMKDKKLNPSTFSGIVKLNNRSWRGSMQIIDPSSRNPIKEIDVDYNSFFNFKAMKYGTWILKFVNGHGLMEGEYQMLVVDDSMSSNPLEFEISILKPETKRIMSEYSADNP